MSPNVKVTTLQNFAEAVSMPTPESGTTGSENGNLSPLYVANLPKPKPRTWILDRWIPEFHITYIFGPGGVFKSWIVLLLSISICKGKPFSHLPTASGGVLWLDWELDVAEFGRRVRALVRGLGLEEGEIPAKLAYLSLTKSLRDDDMQSKLRALIESLAPRLVVIDSYSAACSGGDVNSNDDVAQVMAILRRLGCTVLVIDHTTKTAMSEKQLEATALGGVTKWNLSRSSIVIGSTGGGVMMRHRKTNFGPLMDPLAFQFSFHEEPGTKEETVWVRQAAIDDPEFESLEIQLPAADRIRALLKREAAPLTVDEIVDLLDGAILKKTVKNTLTILKGKNKVVPGPDGRWSLQSPEPPFFKGSGLGTHPESRTESRAVPTSGLTAKGVGNR